MINRSWYSLLHPEDLPLAATSHKSLSKYFFIFLKLAARFLLVNNLFLSFIISVIAFFSSAGRRGLPGGDDPEAPEHRSVMDLDLYPS